MNSVVQVSTEVKPASGVKNTRITFAVSVALSMKSRVAFTSPPRNRNGLSVSENRKSA